jgi:hypothetical protein
MRVLAPVLFVALPGLAAPSSPGPDLQGAVAGGHDADDGVDGAGSRADNDDEDEDRRWRYACDGTDPAFLAEIDEAFRTRVGFGETWDESICNQGALVQGETRARRPPVPATTAVPTVDAALIPGSQATTATHAIAAPGTTASGTTAIGTTAIGTTAAAPLPSTTVPAPPPPPPPTAFEKRLNDQFFALAIPLMAAVAGLFSVVVAALIGLFLRLRRQIVLEARCPTCPARIPFVVGESPQLFCPSCGAPCRVDILGHGDAARAHAVPL